MTRTRFPRGLDTDTDLYHEERDSETAMSAHHNALKDAIKALEEKVGIDGSPVPTSIDYRLALLGSKVIYLTEEKGELILTTEEV